MAVSIIGELRTGISPHPAMTPRLMVPAEPPRGAG
jgi:hypothetical protein